jgi:hypothetical protein
VPRSWGDWAEARRLALEGELRLACLAYFTLPLDDADDRFSRDLILAAAFNWVQQPPYEVRIGTLRQRVEETIERLIAMLDQIDGDVDLEPPEGDEPSFGPAHYHAGQFVTELEVDSEENEASLGWAENFEQVAPCSPKVSTPLSTAIHRVSTARGHGRPTSCCALAVFAIGTAADRLRRIAQALGTA